MCAVITKSPSIEIDEVPADPEQIDRTKRIIESLLAFALEFADRGAAHLRRQLRVSKIRQNMSAIVWTEWRV